MKFAMAAYGWPIFMMMNTGTGLCRLMPYLRYDDRKLRKEVMLKALILHKTDGNTKGEATLSKVLLHALSVGFYSKSK